MDYMLVLPHFFGYPKFTEVFAEKDTGLGINGRKGRKKSDEWDKDPLKEHEEVS